ncbi:hypothetical protein ACNQKP_02955 [Bdellovibrio bacteriovorus]|uniref:hypothetical protein n=1 Tax=Bdellovibrio bacteriovorus TaxID=959 RepID=UPI003AA7D09C
MIKVLTHTALMVLFSATALAGYLPPKENVAYWCYQACIDDAYTNHNECVAECYGGRRPKKTYNNQYIQSLTPGQNQNQNCGEYTEGAETRAAACCSWGEHIQGCMPGC